LALLAAGYRFDEVLLIMAHLASVNRLVAMLMMRSRAASQQRRTDWTLVIALANTALTILAMIALVYYHNLNRLF